MQAYVLYISNLQLHRNTRSSSVVTIARPPFSFTNQPLDSFDSLCLWKGFPNQLLVSFCQPSANHSYALSYHFTHANLPHVHFYHFHHQKLAFSTSPSYRRW